MDHILLKIEIVSRLLMELMGCLSAHRLVWSDLTEGQPNGVKMTDYPQRSLFTQTFAFKSISIFFFTIKSQYLFSGQLTAISMQFKLHNTRWSRTQKTQLIHNLKKSKIFSSKKMLKIANGLIRHYLLMALEAMKQLVH